jgi:hypothetical protein
MRYSHYRHMNLNFLQLNNFRSHFAVIALVIMGVFVMPTPADAAFWDSLLGTFGISSSTYGGYGDSTSYNSTGSQHQGDLEISKKVRRVNKDQDYHEQVTVRSGDLVEVWIEVKNNSKNSASITVTDEVDSNSVYVKNSLRVGVPSTGQLTSDGLKFTLAPKSKMTLTYQENICGASGYAVHASAYAPSVGSASDATIIQMEDSNSYTYNSSNNISLCLNQFNGNGQTNPSLAGPSFNYNDVTSAPSLVSNPFVDWQTYTTASSGAVTTNSNPFGEWTGVNNATSASTESNPFAGWTGVNNSNGSASTTPSTEYNSFGDWTGVSNSSPVTVNEGDPFGDWTKYASSGSSAANGDSFGTWTGSTNQSTNTDPFGDWASYANNGVAYTDDGFNSTGYTDQSVGSASVNQAAAPTALASTSSTTPATNFVAPTTGVNKSAPLVFAAILTGLFLVFKKRAWLFN